MARTKLRRALGILLSLFLVPLVVLGLVSPAQAEDGYEYWNYWHLSDGSWEFSDVGPGQFKPEDGDVEGFRYGTSTPSQGVEPRADLSKVGFEAVCDGVEVATDEKRVAILLDFGTEAGHGTPPEPRAECAVGPADASTQQLLGTVSDVRVEGGMSCAVDGYPAEGCGQPVKNATIPADEEAVSFALPSDGSDTAPAATETSDEGSALSPLLWVAILVLLLAAATLVVNQRRKRG